MDRHQVLAAVLDALAQVLDTFSSQGFAALQADWQQMNAWADQPVRVGGDGECERLGICRGVDQDGALLLETANGLETVLAGDVSLRRS